VKVREVRRGVKIGVFFRFTLSSAMPSRPELREIVATLETMYGKPEPFPSSDPWKLILRESAAYLVDDVTRKEVFRSLEARVGIAPEAILGAPHEVLVDSIRKGGMRAPERADKLLEASTIAQEVGLPKLRQLAKKGGAEARRILKRFPGIGDPGADKLLLAAGGVGSLAPDSNGLRVLVRLGCAVEDANYAKTYRAAAEAVGPELPKDAAWLVAAHQLLRRHGQETCRRSEPRCAICPLAKGCDFARAS
jgi:endonuclease III